MLSAPRAAIGTAGPGEANPAILGVVVCHMAGVAFAK
jgi:hypothetical protein